jgi:3-methyladenine DNA glycosylase AlkC
MTETASPERPLVKDALGLAALDRIAEAGTAAGRDFAATDFLAAARQGLAELSIMERVRHIADALRRALPDDYAKAVKIVRAMGPKLAGGFQAVAVAEFIGRHGLDDFERSTEALADLTRFGTSEFAVRPFLGRYPDRMLGLMTDWSSRDDEHVRRLASEGSRPRLPWAARVPTLSADPTRAAAILDNLKADPSDYVRRSVANHLNDITKDRPDWVLDLLEGWPLDDKRTAGIARHALRSLIKKGDRRALALIGATGEAEISVDAFSVRPASIRLGDSILLAARLTSTVATDQRLVIDYRIHYARKGATPSAKVFKFKTFTLPGGATIELNRRQPIRDFSTRRHHAGLHTVELLANGKIVASAEFDLIA